MKIGKWNIGLKALAVGGAAVIGGILLGKGGTSMIEDSMTKIEPDPENNPKNSDDEEIKELANESKEEAEEPAPEPEVLDENGEKISPD